MAQARHDAEMEYPATPPAKCPDCAASFPNHQTMIQHMGREFRRSNGHTHVHCLECKKYLRSYDALNAHLKRNHPKDQELKCPACGKDFVRVAELVRHIEQKECVRIDAEKLDAVREEKLRFARGLQARHFGDYDEQVEAPYMSRNSALRPKAEATVRPHPVQFEPFETDHVDIYWYHQNVIEPSRIAQSRTITESSSEAPTIKASSPKPQLPTYETSPPINIKKWQQSIPKVGASLLDDFDPDENDRLQPSLIDYYDPGAEDGSGRHGPWSAFFNPWENDDLIGLSTCASSRASSPAASRVLTPRAQSPAATIVLNSPARTVVTIVDSSTKTFQAAAPAKKAAPAMPTKISQALAPAKTSGARPAPTYKHALTPIRGSGGRPASTYNPRTLMPLSNYNLASPTTSSFAVPPTKNSSAAIAPQPSQALTPLKPSQALTPAKVSPAALSAVQKPLLRERATMYQADTPTEGAGAVVPAQSKNGLHMDDYDEVKQAIIDHIALHDPKNPNFRVQNYWEPRIGKYKCPMPQCFKSFKKAGQFQFHIGTHMVEKKVKYPCPGCKDMFDTIAALIAHTESQSIRCQFRHSKNYGHFLSQALAGIVDVVGEDLTHGTVQFAISKDAKKNFGVLTPGKDDARRSRSDEFKAATAALEERAMDEEEENRKFWEEHEREVEARMAKEREEERALQAKLEQEKMNAQHARAAEQERIHQANIEQERRAKEQKAKEREEERALQAKVEQEKMSAQHARAAEQERIHQANIEQERRLKEQKARQADQERIQKVWEAEQERARQAKMLKEPEIKQEPEERKFHHQQWAQVKEETPDIVDGDDMKKLDEEECRLLEKMEKIKEQRWKLQQEKEKRATETAQKEMQQAKWKNALVPARKEMQPQQAAPAFNHDW